jgi:hypothetical protein
MKKLLLLLLAFIGWAYNAFAQLEVKPGSFKEVPGFVNLDLDKQTDDNDRPYAVLKVKTENINDKQRRELKFQGDARTFFEIEYRDGEVWLYISYYATFIKISHPDLSSTEFYFPFDMQPKKGYELTLVNNSKSDIDEQKLNDLQERLDKLETTTNEVAAQTEQNSQNLAQTQAQVAQNQNQNTASSNVVESYNFLTVNAAYNNYGKLSYGLTLGSMKKMGWFISLMSNFNFNGLSTDYECSNEFFVDQYYPFYTGKEVYTSLSATGGVMFKLVDELALKVGAGYGIRNTSYEMVDGKYVKNSDVSSSGIEAVIGAQYRIGKFVVSLDMVTTNFKYYEAKLGLGMGY